MDCLFAWMRVGRHHAFDEDDSVDFIAYLPLEISTMILRKLNTRSLVAATQVSRKWVRAVKSDSVLRKRVHRGLNRRNNWWRRAFEPCSAVQSVSAQQGVKAISTRQRPGGQVAPLQAAPQPMQAVGQGLLYHQRPGVLPAAPLQAAPQPMQVVGQLQPGAFPLVAAQPIQHVGQELLRQHAAPGPQHQLQPVVRRNGELPVRQQMLPPQHAVQQVQRVQRVSSNRPSNLESGSAPRRAGVCGPVKSALKASKRQWASIVGCRPKLR